ncbi:MAG: hypothetical protein ABR936_17370 [Bacteroidota bacterium]|jgi:hypothetical protein
MTLDIMLLSLAIGIISSFIASIMFLKFTNRTNKEEFRIKYSGPVGEYSGYSYTGPNSINIQLEQPVSDAKIEYVSENKLRLTLRELNNPNQWTGIISMETEYYGSVSWRYNILNNKPADITTHSFGFKRLIYLTIDRRKMVYLIGEEWYGKEILIQKSIT